MKRIFIFLVTVLWACASFAQSERVYTKFVDVTQRIKLKTITITDIITNLNNGDSSSNAKIPTAKAIVDFIRLKTLGGGGGGGCANCYDSIYTTPDSTEAIFYSTGSGKRDTLPLAGLSSGVIATLSYVLQNGNRSNTGMILGAYGTFSSDTADVAPYKTFTTGAANYGSSQNSWGISFDASLRIRQRGYIRYVQLHLTNYPARLTSFYVTIWRKSAGVAFNIVDSINIIGKLISGTNIIYLDKPLYAQEGDYIGWGYSSSAAGSNFLHMPNLTGGGAIGYYYNTAATHPADGTAWVGASSLNTYLPLVAYMDAPVVVFIGDSKTSGYNTSISSYTEETTTPVRGQSMPDLVADSLNWTFQNMGIGNTTINQTVSRFMRDVVIKKPKYVVIEIGVNSIAAGISTDSMINDYKRMLAMCTTNAIKPVTIEIIPWTNGTNAQLRQRDTVNQRIRALKDTFGTINFNCDTVLGQFRAGGTAGNYWDLKPAFTSDGVHLTAGGYSAWSSYVFRGMRSLGDTIFPASPAMNGQILQINSPTQGIGFPVLSLQQRRALDETQFLYRVGTTVFQEGTDEGLYLKLLRGFKKVVTQDYPASGTYATLLSLRGMPAGTRFYCTDYLIGDWIYNGTSWRYQIADWIIKREYERAAFNSLQAPSEYQGVNSGDMGSWISAIAGMNIPISISTGSNAAGGSIVKDYAGADGLITLTNTISRSYVRFPTLSTSTDRYIYRIGVMENISTNTDPLNGVFFRYCDSLSSGNWQLVSRAGGNEQAVNSGVAVTANAVYELVTIHRGTSVDFWINGTFAGTVTDGTRIPSVSRGYLRSIFKTSGANPRNAQNSTVELIRF
jgi:lysophospholipase L1-like esterase